MSKLVWSVIGIILIATLGRFLYFKSQDAVSNNPQEITAERVERRAEVSVPKPIPWHEVDKEIVSTLKKSAEAAEVYAAPAIEELIADLQQRIDDDFLNWYFAYWQQQWMGLKGIGYWIMDRGVVEKVIGEQPDMAERITEDIQEEFAKRVLRPQILQLRVERIAGATVQVYIEALSTNLASIPEKYNIPSADWDRYLNDITLLTGDVEGNREVDISLKTIAVSGLAGSVKVAAMLKPVFTKIGTKMATEAAAEGAGKVAVKVAAKTGAKVSAKVAAAAGAVAPFLGPIIGVGVIAWDAWDHHRTEEINRPILRQNLADYLNEIKYSLLYEPETGLLSIIHQLETNVVSELETL